MSVRTASRVAIVTVVTIGSMIPLAVASAAPVFPTVGVGNYPRGAAFDGSYIWVANEDDDSVSKIDPTTRTVVDSVAVGAGPFTVAFDGSDVWVTNSRDVRVGQTVVGTVTRIDPRTDQVVATIVVGRNPRSITFDDSSAWVANQYGGTLTRIDLATNVVVNTVTLTSPPGVLQAVAFDGEALWAIGDGPPRLWKVDPSTGTVILTRTLASLAWSVMFDGRFVWFSDGASVKKLDPRNDTVVAEVEYPDGFSRFVSNLAFDGTRVWVTDFNGDRVWRIDSATGLALDAFTTGPHPYGLAFDGANMWVTIFNLDIVTAIPISAAGEPFTIIPLVDVPEAPLTILLPVTAVLVAFVVLRRRVGVALR